MPYVSFGEVVFEVYEYAEHIEESQFVYARQNTIYPPSITQWLGRELKRINLKARLHAMLSDPEKTYKALLELAEKGQAHRLIIAEQVKGEFVLNSVRASYVQAEASGKPIALELELELTEYVQKELKKTQRAQQQKTQKASKQKQQAPAQGRQSKAVITKEGAKK